MKNLFPKVHLGFLFLFLCEACLAQEWVKPSAGRPEYVQDRSECVQDAQLMALIGEALDKDIAECLVSKGWQRNQANNSMPMYCAEKEAAISCKPGGTEEMYKKDRAECLTQMMQTVGNTYSRPGWYGLGGLIVSAFQAEENKTNLQKTQLQFLRVCLEGKNWAVELRGASKGWVAPPGGGPLLPPTQSVSVPAPTPISPAKALPETPLISAAPVAPEAAPPIAITVAQRTVAAPQPTSTLDLAITAAQESGCKLTGDAEMVSKSSKGVARFEIRCRGYKKPMKIVCSNDDCQRDMLEVWR